MLQSEVKAIRRISYASFLDSLKLDKHFSLWVASVAGWLLMMIATPVVMWVTGDRYIALISSLTVIAQAIAMVLALFSRWSARRILSTMLILFVLTWGVEFVGSQTGLPFGHYSYTEKLQPQLFGVPLLIPIAWLMMLAPAWSTVDGVGPGKPVWVRRVLFAALAGFAMTAWDLYLDPQMTANTMWVWHQDGLYFGIPLLNFFGWWLTSFAVTLILQPSDLPRRRLLVIYTLTWVFQAVGLGIFWGQVGPALAGFAGMSIFVLIGWHRELSQD
jgi:uncharacterized membrane protein